MSHFKPLLPYLWPSLRVLRGDIANSYIRGAQLVRAASTRSKASVAAEKVTEATTAPKKRLSTKATSSIPAKRTTKKSSSATGDEASQSTVSAVVVETAKRAASSKAAAKRPILATAEESNSPAAKVAGIKTAARKSAKPGSEASPSTETSTVKKTLSGSTSRFTGGAEPAKTPEPSAPEAPPVMGGQKRPTISHGVTASTLREREAEAAREAAAQVDTSSKEYKRQARKWTTLITALPIFIVTSYFLYKRMEEIDDMVEIGQQGDRSSPVPAAPVPSDDTK